MNWNKNHLGRAIYKHLPIGIVSSYIAFNPLTHAVNSVICKSRRIEDLLVSIWY